MLPLRIIHFFLLSATFVAAAAALFLTAVLVYAAEPTTFTWRELQNGATIANETSSNAVSAEACVPIILDKAPVGIASVADYATEAVIAINSYDYLNWDEAIPVALNRYFTPGAANQYYGQFRRSRLLGTIRSSYYTVSAINIRPAMVIATSDIDGLRTWTVQVPVTLRYQQGVTTRDGGETVHSQNEVFTVIVYEQRPNRRNFRGVAINDISNQTVRVADDLDRLE